MLLLGAGKIEGGLGRARCYDFEVRIILVITAMGCGGAERGMAWIANRLSRRGHEVSLRVLHGSESFFELDQEVGIRYFSEDHTHSDFRLRRFFQRPAWLRRQIVAECPDVMLSYIDVANVIALWAARPLQVPVVVAERTHPPAHRLPLGYRFLRRLLYPSASRVVMLTESSAKWAREWLEPRRVETIPNSASCPNKNAGVAPRELVSGNRRWIVAMGRLDEVKGFDMLLAAFSQIAREYPDWGLVILGEGPVRAALELDIRERGLAERVVLPGAIKNPEDWLRACHLFVLSSRYEGFPNALCEAMACGLPVVSFDCPVGPAEIIIDGEDGLLVPAGDVFALAATLRRLLDRPDEAALMGKRAAMVVERFGQEAIAARWEDLLLSATRHRHVCGNGRV